jgi:hypothetical protein
VRRLEDCLRPRAAADVPAHQAAGGGVTGWVVERELVPDEDRIRAFRLYKLRDDKYLVSRSQLGVDAGIHLLCS